MNATTALPLIALDLAKLDQVRREWLAITKLPDIDLGRFADVKRQADELAERGLWDTGPSDMLGVLGRQRDELVHSRMIGWLLVPTHRHGLKRAVLTRFLDTLWPGEELMREGPVTMDLELPETGPDVTGTMRDARADIVLRGDGITIVIENKVDAGEQVEQCERLYWAFANKPGEIRWLFLTPSGRAPQSAVSADAKSAWATMSYRTLRDIVATALASVPGSSAIGRATALQYLETLTRSLPRHD